MSSSAWLWPQCECAVVASLCMCVRQCCVHITVFSLQFACGCVLGGSSEHIAERHCTIN